jgi:hypothetical protein
MRKTGKSQLYPANKNTARQISLTRRDHFGIGGHPLDAVAEEARDIVSVPGRRACWFDQTENSL